MENISYIGISKAVTRKFKKYDYLLSFQDDGELIIGEILVYGYLIASFRKNSPRGYYKRQISCFKRDFESWFELKQGTIKLKINEF